MLLLNDDLALQLVSTLPAGGKPPVVLFSDGNVYQFGKKTCKFIDQLSIPNYFCDSVNGNDANDGLTADTPKKTVSAIKALATTSCVMNFKCGSYFREELSEFPSNCVVKSYGSGDRPVFDCADIVTSFIKTGGYTNIYQVTFSNQLTVATKSWLRMWQNGNLLIRVTSYALCESTPGSYFAQRASLTGTDTIYFHPEGSTNPSVDGNTYEVSVRKYGVKASEESEIYDCHGKRNGHEYGSIVTTKYAENCLAVDGVVHCFFNAGIAKNCEANIVENGSCFVSFKDTATTADTYLYENCSANGSATTHHGYKNSGDVGVLWHTNDDSKFGNISLINCSFRDLDTAIGASDTVDVSVYGATFRNVIRAITASSGDRIHVIKSKFLEYPIDSTLRTGLNAFVCAVSEIRCFGNLFVARSMDRGLLFSTAPKQTYKGNTFYFTDSSVNMTALFGYDYPANISFKNNIFQDCKQWYVSTTSLNPTMDNDNNLFNNADYCKVRTLAGTWYNLPTYKAALSQDLNSVVGDPLFTGNVRDGDYSIAANSPANYILAGCSNYIETQDDLSCLKIWNKLT